MTDLDLPYLGLRRSSPSLSRVEDHQPMRSYPSPSQLLNVQDPIRVDPGLLDSIDGKVAYNRPQETSYDPTHAMSHAQGMESFNAYRASEERPYSKTTGDIL